MMGPILISVLCTSVGIALALIHEAREHPTVKDSFHAATRRVSQTLRLKGVVNTKIRPELTKRRVMKAIKQASSKAAEKAGESKVLPCHVGTAKDDSQGKGDRGSAHSAGGAEREEGDETKTENQQPMADAVCEL